MPENTEYELRPVWEEFQEDYDRIVEESDEDIPGRLFMELRHAPKDVSRELRADFRGFRSRIVDDVQVIFVCCDECIGNGHVDRINCDDCEDIHGQNQSDPQGNMIKLFSIRNVEPHNRSS